MSRTKGDSEKKRIRLKEKQVLYMKSLDCFHKATHNPALPSKALLSAPF